MKLYTVKNFALKNKESGTWPSSEAAINVFIKVGRRVLIDEEKFLKALDEGQKQ